MKPKEFLEKLDEARIVAAIAAAERMTSGEIRVFVSSRRLGKDDVLRRAERRFLKLGMAATALRNGVLFYFVPRDRRFAIVGDRGIHERCGGEFWTEIASGLNVRLIRGEFTEGVAEAIAQAGAALAEHFPIGPKDRNELPDGVERD
jgi:uncharacterized membrane protein